jgi:hypothetical protein
MRVKRWAWMIITYAGDYTYIAVACMIAFAAGFGVGGLVFGGAL